MNIKTLSVIIFILFPFTVKSQSSEEKITEHLTAITKTNGFRHYQNLPVLNEVANYIHSVFSQYADTTYFQTYKVNGETYKNVVCRFGSDIKKTDFGCRSTL